MRSQSRAKQYVTVQKAQDQSSDLANEDAFGNRVKQICYARKEK